jgi:hypothetical protein
MIRTRSASAPKQSHAGIAAIEKSEKEKIMKIDVQKLVAALRKRFASPKHLLAAMGLDENLNLIRGSGDGPSAGGAEKAARGP